MKLKSLYAGVLLLVFFTFNVVFAQQDFKSTLQPRPDSARVNLFFSSSVKTDSTIEPLLPETIGVIRYLEQELGFKFDLVREPWKRALT